MKKTRTIVILLQFFVLTSLGQDFAFIKFSNTELLETNLTNDCSFDFYVNGQKISPNSSVYKIKINRDSFDTLIYDCKRIGSSISLTKFKQGQTYIIKINPCSFYELIPDQKGKLGIVRFDKLKTDSYLLGLLDNGRDTISKLKGTRFLTPISSAMCSFDSKKIEIATVDYKDYENEKIIYKMNFHFLHGEKILVLVSNDNKEFTLKLEGYLNENESFEDYEIE